MSTQGEIVPFLAAGTPCSWRASLSLGKTPSKTASIRQPTSSRCAWSTRIHIPHSKRIENLMSPTRHHKSSKPSVPASGMVDLFMKHQLPAFPTSSPKPIGEHEENYCICFRTHELQRHISGNSTPCITREPQTQTDSVAYLDHVAILRIVLARSPSYRNRMQRPNYWKKISRYRKFWRVMGKRCS